MVNELGGYLVAKRRTPCTELTELVLGVLATIICANPSINCHPHMLPPYAQADRFVRIKYPAKIWLFTRQEWAGRRQRLVRIPRQVVLPDAR